MKYLQTIVNKTLFLFQNTKYYTVFNCIYCIEVFNTGKYLICVGTIDNLNLVIKIMTLSNLSKEFKSAVTC